MAWETVYSVSALNCLHIDLHWTGLINVCAGETCNKQDIQNQHNGTAKRKACMNTVGEKNTVEPIIPDRYSNSL